MKKFLVLSVIMCGMFFPLKNAFAKEISIGEMRSVGLNTQIINIHFKEMHGRNCIVDVAMAEGGKEVFYKELIFDWEREERTLLIGDKKMLLFYVTKGVLAFLDDKEI